jgi:hypothetical protein
MIPTSFVETVRRILEEQESRSRARKHLKMYFKSVDKPKDGYSKTVPADVSVLRRLDVILWMEGTRYLKIKTR